MSEYATIVTAMHDRDWLGRRYGAAVVRGTIKSYYPAEYSIRRWTATGAKRAGDREIRRRERAQARRNQRYAAARRVTGHER